MKIVTILIAISIGVRGQNSLDDESIGYTYEDCVKFTEKFANTCKKYKTSGSFLRKPLFDEIEDEELTCKGMGKCPLASSDGVTLADLKLFPTEEKCTFKRKLCVICSKENEKER